MSNLKLSTYALSGRLLGSRNIALPIRDELKLLLECNEKVEIDFSSINPTQSFIDELIGVLVLERGKSVLSHLVFKNCSFEVRAILHLVVSDRIDQYIQSNRECEFAAEN